MRREEYLMRKTTEQLIEAYAWESNRIDEKDRKMAQAAILRELKYRFNTVLALLDDEQTVENPKGTYRRLIEG